MDRPALDAGRFPIVWGGSHCQEDLLAQGVSISFLLDGQLCDAPRSSVHVLLIRCRHEQEADRTRTNIYMDLPFGDRLRAQLHTLDVVSIQGAVRHRNGSQMRYTDGPRVSAAPVQCTGTVVYEERTDQSSERNLWVSTRAAWAAAGFTSSWVFARKADHCRDLMRLPGLLCHVQRAVDERLERASHYRYDQVINSNVCLLYARAAGTRLLALTDADEHPSSRLSMDAETGEIPPILEMAEDQGLAGFSIWYDADRACPRNFCPRTAAAVTANCALPARPRPTWKIMVLPGRVASVSAHAVQRDVSSWAVADTRPYRGDAWTASNSNHSCLRAETRIARLPSMHHLCLLHVRNCTEFPGRGSRAGPGHALCY